MSGHRHRIKSTRTYCYRGSIAGAREERRAHGGVLHVDECSCGAKRETNANGYWQEKGRWYIPEQQERA